MEKKKYQQFYGVFALNFYAYLHTGNSLYSFYFIDIMNIVFPVADFLCTSNIKLLIVVLGYFFRNYCQQYAYLHTGNSLYSIYSIDIMNIVFPVADFLCTSNIKLLIVVLGYFFRNYCEQYMFCSAVFIVTVAVSLFLNLMSQMTWYRCLKLLISGQKWLM